MPTVQEIIVNPEFHILLLLHVISMAILGVAFFTVRFFRKRK